MAGEKIDATATSDVLPDVLPDVLIVGGGPAGMMAGLLLARAGVRTHVLEKHNDFLRDFRGDTVHPSTMEILNELGMLDRFLARPHNRIAQARVTMAGRDWTMGDLSHLRVAAPFIAMMPQWDFLDFLLTEARAWPGFSFEHDAHVTRFIGEEGRITGVTLADGRAIKPRKLVIAADGRRSLARALLPVRTLGAPMDVFWLRLPKPAHVSAPTGDGLRGVFAPGRILIFIDRGDYWQCAMVFPKGGADQIRARGIVALRRDIEEAAPFAGPLDDRLTDIGQLNLLSVSLDRLERWHRPGLLAIGDAAHVMSPIGGIGINLAIQDAVATANILSDPLLNSPKVDHQLHKVERRRLWPTRIIQRGQKLAQDIVIGAVLDRDRPLADAPLLLRLLDRCPRLRRIPGRIIGLGIRREHVRSPSTDPAPTR